MTIRVLLVDDQDLVRAGFAMVLGSQPDIEVVGEAGDGRAAVRLARDCPADVAVMDVRMPELDGVADLTVREREVLAQAGGGLSNTEIAALLSISEATVKTHIGHIMAKLGLRDRIQIVVYAYETGLITPQGRAPDQAKESGESGR